MFQIRIKENDFNTEVRFILFCRDPEHKTKGITSFEFSFTKRQQPYSTLSEVILEDVMFSFSEINNNIYLVIKNQKTVIKILFDELVQYEFKKLPQLYKELCNFLSNKNDL